jgi:hypothetical protein
MAGHNNSSNGDSQQQKTQHPVQFEITEQTRTVLEAWMRQAHLRSEVFFRPGEARQRYRRGKKVMLFVGYCPTSSYKSSLVEYLV